MFNSPIVLAASAAVIGAVSNTLRLELVDMAGMPPAAAAFIGAFCAGILASALKNRVGYPRISLTVPSIVIMVPGLYLYRAVYNLGIMSLCNICIMVCGSNAYNTRIAARTYICKNIN